jgi:asparagine synthase (glutamine-hydrolysing)
MCGIVGFFGQGDSSDLVALTRLLAHRGPDGEGFFVDSERGVFLGHRRLAIRDAIGGVQPMMSDDGRFVLVYNGEIYNDLELRNELEALGHRFHTESDTEVLLHSLMEWGSDALARLDGQFALCFVDVWAERVVLARDRFGEKPLFWSKQHTGILFASESSSLAQHPWVTPELDEESCTRYLLLGYLPPPYSILKGIHQVRPGVAICFNLNRADEIQEIMFAKPWEPWLLPSNASEAKSSFSIELAEEAVNSRRVSNVPVGMLLSGGVDSSLLVSSAITGGWKPETFTIGFASSSFDESRQAAQLAAHLGVENFVRTLQTCDDVRLLKILRTLDEPLGDASYLPAFEVFEMAAERVKVLITGDGGDELFFGYEPFRAFLFSERLAKWMPSALINVAILVAKRLPRSETYMNKLSIAERFLDGLRYPSLTRVLVWMSTLRTYEWSKFFTKELNREQVYGDVERVERGANDLETIRRFFLRSYLPGSIFSKSDTASMANSVEARTAFLHPEIIEFALSQQWRDELSQRTGKRSLRQLCSSLGLRSVANRKKHGFALPIGSILKETNLPPPVIHLSSIRQEAVEDAWNAAKSGSVGNLSFLWAALALVNSRSYRLATSRTKD